MQRLSGKAAVVTGASGGVGAAIAASLAEHGADVLLTAAPPHDSTTTSSAIERRSGRSPVVFVADVTAVDDVEACGRARRRAT